MHSIIELRKSVIERQKASFIPKVVPRAAQIRPSADCRVKKKQKVEKKRKKTETEKKKSTSYDISEGIVDVFRSSRRRRAISLQILSPLNSKFDTLS